MPRGRLTRLLRDGATLVDRQAAGLGLCLEGPALLSFLFHVVLDRDDELQSGVIHPQDALTRDSFRMFLEHLLEAGYRFVSLADVEAGLDPGGRYACVTFDDGYANNLRAVELLREYGVPAAIFVTTGNVEQGTRFWWDVVYAERARRGEPEHSIHRELDWLEATLDPLAIAGYVESMFGAGSTKPRSDLDRPLSPPELRSLAANDLVTVGNHTADHTILSRATPDEIRRAIGEAQAYLDALPGTPRRALAYPNGDYDERVLAIARELGFPCAMTTVRRKERLPIPAERLLALGRLQLQRGAEVGAQLRVARSGIQLANVARRIRDRRRRARR